MKIIVRSPLYRGFLLILINAIFYGSVLSLILLITSLITGIYELLGISIVFYSIWFFSFILLKIYKKTSKTYIEINRNEIVKVKQCGIIKSIKVQDIVWMNFSEYTFGLDSFDEFTICSVSKVQIKFYEKKSLVSKIEQITCKEFKKH